MRLRDCRLALLGVVEGSALNGVKSDQSTQKLRAARTQQPPKAYYLASLEIEADTIQRVAATEAIDAKQLWRIGGAMTFELPFVFAAPEHVVDNFLLRNTGGSAVEHGAAIAHDRHIVTDQEDLIDEVCDVDDGDPTRLKST